ncbi:terpene synthase family protein [Streptomyces prunicolor]|uniref:terpene synthase family protein n=1 Tax=Streptomyces prunicolor TaxID=67348 RepID=UPI0038665DA8|nr:terpene synthase family protein [Streptomyces prunicolor]
MHAVIVWKPRLCSLTGDPGERAAHLCPNGERTPHLGFPHDRLAAFLLGDYTQGLGLPPRLRRLHSRWKTDWIESEQRMAAYGNTPDPAFMEDRHHAVGMMLGPVVFTQHGLGIDLPSDVIEHPLFQEALWSPVRVASWQSDLLTLEAEEARGEFVNTVGVVSATLGASHQESVADLDSYLDGILSASAGFLGWNQMTDRKVTAMERARILAWRGRRGDPPHRLTHVSACAHSPPAASPSTAATSCP